jgi:hypothetical protein
MMFLRFEKVKDRKQKSPQHSFERWKLVGFSVKVYVTNFFSKQD